MIEAPQIARIEINPNQVHHPCEYSTVGDLLDWGESRIASSYQSDRRTPALEFTELIEAPIAGWIWEKNARRAANLPEETGMSDSSPAVGWVDTIAGQ